MTFKGRSWRSSCFLPVIGDSSLPAVGAGALPNTPPTKTACTIRTKKRHSTPRAIRRGYRLARNAPMRGVAVSMFLAPSKYMDTGTVCAVPNQTGGEVFWHPRFFAPRDASILRGPAQPAGLAHARLQLHGARAVFDPPLAALLRTFRWSSFLPGTYLTGIIASMIAPAKSIYGRESLHPICPISIPEGYATIAHRLSVILLHLYNY